MAFVGQRDFWPDGSSVTTKWIIAFFVPLVPLRSLRVKARPQRVTLLYVAAYSERDYQIRDETSPHPRQVACVYGFILFYLACILGTLSLLSHFAGRLSHSAGVALTVALMGVPWVIPWRLRERAKRWRPGFK